MFACALPWPAMAGTGGVCTNVPAFAEVAPAARPGAHGRGLLWRVEREGQPPSHLFGTIHLSDPDIVELAPAVRTVFDAGEAYVMETLLEPEDLLEFSQMMLYPDGPGLRERVGDGLFELAVRYLRRHGVTEPTAGRMRPWAVFATLSFPPSENGEPLDLVLRRRAQERGQEVFGLESMREQGQALAGMEEEAQVRMLRDTVCHYERIQEEIQAMKRLWLARDLDGLVGVMNRYADGSAESEAFFERLLYARNRRMVERMQAHLRRGGRFIAVGALHLPGEQGILALLARRGYTVTAVY